MSRGLVVVRVGGLVVVRVGGLVVVRVGGLVVVRVGGLVGLIDESSSGDRPHLNRLRTMVLTSWRRGPFSGQSNA
jgi:hypothetical protein